ncbi:hypothetical protein ACO2Q3_14915 [Caulobacter sp. KR2-114]|uniref:hypothetical protein n=1 Tax=Caulobacter sp. KR2-114 TaxID=3400912 RepID=UPI003C0A63AF
MRRLQRFRLFAAVLPVVLLLIGLKVLAHQFHLEFLALDGLIPSLVAGAIFLIGFLLSHVLSDYKEAERTVSEMRVSLEAIHGDIAGFAATAPQVDIAAVRLQLADFVAVFERCLDHANRSGDMTEVILRADAMGELFVALERQQMSERYLVRLRGALDALRRSVFRIAYIQHMQFVPSVHVMVQTLVASCLFVMLFLRTAVVLEGALVLGFVGYMFIYAIFLVRHLEKPFRKGEHTVDDVSIFLLRQFAAKMRALAEGEPASHARHPHAHQGGGGDEHQEAVHAQQPGLGQPAGVGGG